MSNIIVEFYHAQWCGACQRFKPDWKKLQNMYLENKDLISYNYEKMEKYKLDNSEENKQEKEQLVVKLPDKKITFIDYDEADNQQKITDENIEFFPTIKFKVNGKSYNYPRNKKRTAEEIYKFINNEEYNTISDKEQDMDNDNNMYKQCGGGYDADNDYYKLKYYKYKYKYFKLKY